MLQIAGARRAPPQFHERRGKRQVGRESLRLEE